MENVHCTQQKFKDNIKKIDNISEAYRECSRKNERRYRLNAIKNRF